MKKNKNLSSNEVYQALKACEDYLEWKDNQIIDRLRSLYNDDYSILISNEEREKQEREKIKSRIESTPAYNDTLPKVIREVVYMVSLAESRILKLVKSCKAGESIEIDHAKNLIYKKVNGKRIGKLPLFTNNDLVKPVNLVSSGFIEESVRINADENYKRIKRPNKQLINEITDYILIFEPYKFIRIEHRTFNQTIIYNHCHYWKEKNVYCYYERVNDVWIPILLLNDRYKVIKRFYGSNLQNKRL